MIGLYLFLFEVQLKTHKTKDFLKTLQQLQCSQVLIVVDEISFNLRLATRNLPGVEIINYRNLNVYRIMKYAKVIFEKEALTAVEGRLLS